MTYLLIRDDIPPGVTTTNAIEVTVCPEDGTVYAVRSIMCPVCQIWRKLG